MSYLENLKTEANHTRTMNGAMTHSTSGDACLDFFAVAGGMRYRRRQDQIGMFETAYVESPDLAMKLLFHLRDIRGGMGERQLFRTLLRYMAFEWPESIRKNVPYIPEFGRWDDLICLIGTPAEKQAVDAIKKQLAEDEAALTRRQAGDENAHISLLAKWLPSDNTSSPRTRSAARRLIKSLGMDSRDYRRRVTALRARIALTERQLSEKRPERINYGAVPSQAMLKYRCTFERADSERFSSYLSDVRNGSGKINASTLFPYEALRPFFSGSFFSHTARGMDALEQIWSHLPGSVDSLNAISVVDTSGSMYWSQQLKPALISQAMGLYCAERCDGVFRNHLITFESTPHLIRLHGKTLREKLAEIRDLPFGGSTNLEAVFNLLLNTAIKYRAKQKEMPKVIYIFSDMEFDRAVSDADKTVYENAKERFEAHGYKMPAVVFHNVNSWQKQTPVRSHTRGTALTSGASSHALGYKFDGNITPMAHMLRVLNSRRYAMISA